MVDTKENRENSLLLGGISGGNRILRRRAAENIARRIHPTARLRLFAEHFQSAAPNRGSSPRVDSFRPEAGIRCECVTVRPYHYKMIAEDFLFDLTQIKNHLGWKPTLTNEEMLFRAYQYYAANRREIEQRQNVSAHRKSASMGAIRLLKWVS